MKRFRIDPNLVRILSCLKPYKKEFRLISISLLFTSIIAFLQPLVIRTLTDEGMLRLDMTIVFRSALILFGLILINQIISIWQTHIFADIHNQSYYAIFHQVYDKLLHIEKTYFEDKNSAEIINYLVMDVSQVASITDRYIVMSASYIFKIFSGSIGLFIISWKLALVVLIMAPIKFYFVRRLASKQEVTTKATIEANQSFSQWFEDSLNGVEEIKLWNLYQQYERGIDNRQNDLLDLKKNSTMLDGWNTFTEILIEWSVTILLYLVGGGLVCTGSLTIGAVLAFISYSGYVTGPVSALLNLKMYLARIMPSAQRLFRFLDMKTEADTGVLSTSQLLPRLEFSQVSFRYEEDRWILVDASFVVEPGEKVAIIGSNGSGKSTILNLLLRFYQPSNGRILLNGQDICTYALEDYRNLFAVVSQEPYLFLGNVLENVDLLRTTSQDKLESALLESGVEEFITRMPNRDQTQVGRNGAKLSGGEKQKIAVARALLKDAPVVLLDEAATGFDVESDSYLQQIILNQMNGKSVIMITHHYDNLKGMDKVYRLEDGQLIKLDVDLIDTLIREY